jgi:hypothetical protein
MISLMNRLVDLQFRKDPSGRVIFFRLAARGSVTSYIRNPLDTIARTPI